MMQSTAYSNCEEVCSSLFLVSVTLVVLLAFCGDLKDGWIRGVSMFVPMMALCWIVNFYVDKRLEFW